MTQLDLDYLARFLANVRQTTFCAVTTMFTLSIQFPIKLASISLFNWFTLYLPGLLAISLA